MLSRNRFNGTQMNTDKHRSFWKRIKGIRPNGTRMNTDTHGLFLGSLFEREAVEKLNAGRQRPLSLPEGGEISCRQNPAGDTWP
jgi:hypothetical protein